MTRVVRSFSTPVNIALNAAIVAVTDASPRILCMPGGPETGHSDGLPFGAFDPASHRTFESGLRQSVESLTALTLGYVEQLYTFGDRGRHRVDGGEGGHPVSVGYLALTSDQQRLPERLEAKWRGWYSHFPWEDHRDGRPTGIRHEPRGSPR